MPDTSLLGRDLHSEGFVLVPRKGLLAHNVLPRGNGLENERRVGVGGVATTTTSAPVNSSASASDVHAFGTSKRAARSAVRGIRPTSPTTSKPAPRRAGTCVRHPIPVPRTTAPSAILLLGVNPHMTGSRFQNPTKAEWSEGRGDLGDPRDALPAPLPDASAADRRHLPVVTRSQ